MILPKLILFALLGGEALAQEAPPFPSEIVHVPPGSTITLGPKRHLVSGKAWLFPESHYLSALHKAEKLGICEPALVKLREDFANLLQSTSKESAFCLNALHESNQREQDLTLKILEAEKLNQDLRSKLDSSRRANVLAWSITGALLLGAGTSVYLAD
jgi:hypothetical protein